MYGSLWKTLKNEPLVAKVFLIQPRTSCLNFQYCVDFRDVLNCWWIQLVLYRSVMPRAYWTCRTGRAAGEIGKFWGSVWEVFVYVCIFLRKRKRFRWLIGWPGWLHVYSSFFHVLAQSTNPGRWDSSILRDPCAHFWLWNQAVNCEILLRISHCADFCEDYVFIKNSS
jgi:hypothetical protein